MEADMRPGEFRHRHNRMRGFSLPVVLVAIVLAGLAWSIAGPLWAHSEQRLREQELMRVGLLYAQALAAYRDAAPGGAKAMPHDLSHLLRDPRYVGVQRHLRSLYPDPVDSRLPWGTVRDAHGRIVGVYSQSSRQPIARGPVSLADRTLPPAATYSDWKFLALDRRASP